MTTWTHHVTRSCWRRMSTLGKKSPPCFLPEPDMCFSLLCCAAFFFFWGTGKSLLWSCWIPISGLSPVAAKSAFLLGFHCTYCLIPYRLHKHWGHPESRSSVKGKGQKAKMDCVPIKGHMNIYRYRKKPEGAFEFLIYLKNQDINCGRYRSIWTAIFDSVAPKLTLQPGNQLHRGRGLGSVFLCQQPVHSAARQLFLEHKLTMDPAQEISGVVGG